MYKAVIKFPDQSKLLPVRMSLKFFWSDVLTDFQIIAQVFRVTYNNHKSNEQFTDVRSCRNTPPTTLISVTDG
jgi:hypothetical protein